MSVGKRLAFCSVPESTFEVEVDESCRSKAFKRTTTRVVDGEERVSVVA